MRSGRTAEQWVGRSSRQRILGATRFREIIASEELAVVGTRGTSSLFVYPNAILGTNGRGRLPIPLSMEHRLGKRAIVGYLDASRLGVLLCGVNEDRARRIAQGIRNELPAGANGASTPEMYSLGSTQTGVAADPLGEWDGDPAAGTPDTVDRRWAMPVWKRAFDVIGAALALILLLPLMLLLAIVIKLVSRGPILFCQERIGFRGEPFRCCKFRSMHWDAPVDEHQKHLAKLIREQAPMKKLDHQEDERLIPFGRFLRAGALDELPQLLNVLRGDMSLVGPRPAIRYEYEEYEPWQRGRFDAVPGMTGLWQVSGKNHTTFSEMVRMDIRYAYLKSFLLDLRILIATPRVVIAQIAELMRKNGANHEEAVEPRSGWVRVLGTQSDT